MPVWGRLSRVEPCSRGWVAGVVLQLDIYLVYFHTWVSVHVFVAGCLGTFVAVHTMLWYSLISACDCILEPVRGA